MRTLHSIKMRLSREEQGQTVSEYSLLLAFLLLVSACLFLSSANDVSAIWQTANGLISHGASAAESGKH
jgi:Flp pilus assembly pilin Flp